MFLFIKHPWAFHVSLIQLSMNKERKNDIEERKCYLERKNTAYEDQNHEHQTEITKSSNFLLVGEVLRLRSQKNKRSLRNIFW